MQLFMTGKIIIIIKNVQNVCVFKLARAEKLSNACIGGWTIKKHCPVIMIFVLF